jgi:hypothetical protein
MSPTLVDASPPAPATVEVAVPPPPALANTPVVVEGVAELNHVSVPELPFAPETPVPPEPI